MSLTKKISIALFFCFLFLFKSDLLAREETISCSCPKNEWCSAGKTHQSACYDGRGRFIGYEGCDFDAGCMCRPNGCGGGGEEEPTPTPTPTYRPTPIPTPAPQPSCTVSLSPSTVTLYRGETWCCIVANVNARDGTVSQVNFTSINPAVASLTPRGPRSTEVNGHKTGQTQVLAQVTLSPSGECTSAPVLVAVAERTPGWFQTKEGDVHAGGSIHSRVLAGKNFSLGGSGGFPGVVSFAGSSADFSPGRISSKGWLAQSPVLRKPFSYFYSLLGSPSPNYSGPYLPSESGVYFADHDIAISSSGSLPAGKKVVILVNGNVNITKEIDVREGSFLFVVASGDINIDSEVSRVEGIFLADKMINIRGGNKPFTGEGSFIAGSISLGRGLGEDNLRDPAEMFVYRPDFFVNSPSSLWSSYHVWEELAP